MSDNSDIEPQHESAADLTTYSLDFNKAMYSWAGITASGEAVTFAVNAETEEDAVQIGLRVAVMNGHRATQFATIEVAEFLAVNDDGESGTA